jgi:hypothetical protein
LTIESVKRGIQVSHRGLLYVLAAVLLLLGIIWLLAIGSRGEQFAAVLALGVAILALAQPNLLQARSFDHAKLAGAARSLARDVAGRERAEQQKFLADSGQSAPADIGFSQPEILQWRTDGGGSEGSLSDIMNFYGGLRHGRLVVLGEAGAGKTVLANQLLLDLITALPPEDPAPGTTFKVPVRLSLPSFSPGEDSYSTDGVSLSGELDSWISNCLAEIYGINIHQARALVRDGWILPVLDGLDEMDPVSEPVRAVAVIHALNHPAGPGLRPVILSCRTERYGQLADAAAAPGQRPVLQDATAIAIQPLTATQISAYLTSRFPDPADRNSVQQRWEPVLRALLADDGDCPLLTVLSSPFYLYLAVTAYDSGTTCPAELTSLPAERLRPYLLDRLIPAVTARPDGTTFDPADVTRWLTALAGHLEARRVRHGEAGTDIRLHELWTIAGERAPRYLTATLLALLAPAMLLISGPGSRGIANSVGAFLTSVSPLRAYPGSVVYPGPALYLVSYFLFLLVLGSYCFLCARNVQVSLIRFDLSALRARPARQRLLRGLTAGLLAWELIMFCWAVADGTPGQWPSLIADAFRPGETLFSAEPSRIFLYICTLGGIAIGLVNQPAAISRPGQVVKQGLTHDLSILVMFGVVMGGIFAITFEGIVFNASDWIYLLFGLSMGIAWLSDSPWPRYLVAIRLAGRRRLPSHPAMFLDWAYSAGLLRLAGIACQFRHSDLQDHLVAARHQLVSPARAELHSLAGARHKRAISDEHRSPTCPRPGSPRNRSRHRRCHPRPRHRTACTDCGASVMAWSAASDGAIVADTSSIILLDLFSRPSRHAAIWVASHAATDTAQKYSGRTDARPPQMTITDPTTCADDSY